MALNEVNIIDVRINVLLYFLHVLPVLKISQGHTSEDICFILFYLFTQHASIPDVIAVSCEKN